MFRLLASVVLCYALIGVLVVATDQVFTLVLPGFEAFRTPPDSYFLISLATYFIYWFLGGWLCSWIAKIKAPQAILALMVVGEVIGVTTQVGLWNAVPHWFGVGLLLLYPVGVWLGSRMRRPRQSSGSKLASG